MAPAFSTVIRAATLVWPVYEDAELADTIVAVGTNALETQINYFLNHWVPNLRGTSIDKKRAEFGNEPVERARVIIVDPRRTVTVNACEVEAGKDRVMHLAINPGTDLALFNGWLTYIAEKVGLTRRSSLLRLTTLTRHLLATERLSIKPRKLLAFRPIKSGNPRNGLHNRRMAAHVGALCSPTKRV